MMDENKSPSGAEVLTIVQSILDEQRHIVLPPRDVALLLLIWNYIKTQKNLVFTVSEQEIRFLASRLDDLESRDAQGSEKRYTESISRLLKSECLTRSDMNRLILSSDAEYQLTSFGESVASWHFEHEQFSGEPLTAILKAFNSHLLKIAIDAEEDGSSQNWHTDVLMQMQVVLKNMLVDVHRHQRELDRQHDHLRQFIPSLLTESSESSIRFCEEQLAQVIQTIDDLQEVTLAAANTAFQQLENIESIGLSRGIPETEVICGEIERRLGSIIQWTTQRATDWVEHHNVVHEFLRTVVYVDRNRRITDALKRAVAGEPQWVISTINEMPLMRFRDDMTQAPRRLQSPRRAKRDYSHDIEEIAVDQVPEKLQKILDGENAVEIYLSSMLRKALDKSAPESRIAFHLPWFIGKMIEKGTIDNKTRPWETVTETLDVEELKVRQGDIRKP
jgi:chromosome condensin MukBEF complex kleisin-like MukF subunit